MHCGFERPRALQGVKAHHACVSNPEPSHAFFVARDDFASTLDVCTVGRAFRWRSRGAGRAACGTAALGRCAFETASEATAESAVRASCTSGFTQSATGSARGEAIACSAADGAGDAAVASVVATIAGVTDERIVGVVVAVDPFVGTTADVAPTLDVAKAASSAERASPAGGNEGRSSVQAPQPSASRPSKASETAALT